MSQLTLGGFFIKKGKFIVFEGTDGSGKSTQIATLKQKLKSLDIPCFDTHEPTDSPFGSLIHQIMTGRIKTDNKVIAPLFVADRLDHLLNENGIVNKLNSGYTVISDRYYFSSYAYQGVDIDMDKVIDMNGVCAEILRPDLTIFIDLPPEISMERIKSGRNSTELFETLQRLSLVRDNFYKAFEKVKCNENIVIFDGRKSPEDLAADIWESVGKLFS